MPKRSTSGEKTPAAAPKKSARSKLRKVQPDDVYAHAPLTASQKSAKMKVLSEPVRQVVVGRGAKVADLVDAMAGMSIQARNLGTCAKVLSAMLTDKRRPTILLGLAGPLIAAGLRRVIRDLVVGGYVDVVVSTGAILYQDIYQARGFSHYRGTPAADDKRLRDLRIDRIYDTYVDEDKFWDTDEWCGNVADELEPGNYSSRAYLDFLGSKLRDEESIVRQCHLLGVPMFCPAINDSSIGIGLTDHYHRCRRDGRGGVAIDSIRDNYELVQVVAQSPSTAAIYVAGGVPKNYINDSVVMGYIFGLERGHDYAIQVTTAVVQDGGLSSSTLGEAQSWGKIAKQAKFAMAWVEPSVSLPMLAGYAFDRHPPPVRQRLKLSWEGEFLRDLRIAPKREGR